MRAIMAGFGVTTPLILALLACVAWAQETSTAGAVLGADFDLGGARLNQPQYFATETRVCTFNPDGALVGTDTFRLRLKCLPSRTPGTEEDQYTCLRFTVQRSQGPERAVPALAGWTYAFAGDGYDEKGQVFGIDHARFEGLADSTGAPLPPDKTYMVYNAFVDFHAMCDVFAQPAQMGSGIQNLTRIGQRIVHAAAFTQPPVNLGTNVLEGSFFKNGEITLELKGLSLAAGKQCALIGYDSGESSFKMIMKPMPNLEVQTVGRSHYWGDIYKNLATNWVEKAVLSEVVIFETTLPTPPGKFSSVVERSIVIINLGGSPQGPE